MFIRSNMEIPVFYNKGEHSIELKPQTITYVDDAIVSKQELIDCYGDRITLIAEEIVKEIMAEGAVDANETNIDDEEVDTPDNSTEEETKKLAEEKAKKEAEAQAQKEAEEKAKKAAEEKAAAEAKKLAEEETAKAKKAAKSSTKNTKAGKNK